LVEEAGNYERLILLQPRPRIAFGRAQRRTNSGRYRTQKSTKAPIQAARFRESSSLARDFEINPTDDTAGVHAPVFKYVRLKSLLVATASFRTCGRQFRRCRAGPARCAAWPAPAFVDGERPTLTIDDGSVKPGRPDDGVDLPAAARHAAPAGRSNTVRPVPVGPAIGGVPTPKQDKNACGQQSPESRAGARP
jgi:hypothetical protein